MTLRKIDYEKVKKIMLKYLYAYRHVEDTDKRSTTQIMSAFRITISTFNAGMYELKGMGCVVSNNVANTRIWSITDKGIETLMKPQENNQDIQCKMCGLPDKLCVCGNGD